MLYLSNIHLIYQIYQIITSYIYQCAGADLLDLLDSADHTGDWEGRGPVRVRGLQQPASPPQPSPQTNK